MADPETAKSTQDGPGAGHDQSDPAGPQARTSPSTVKQEPEVAGTAAAASNGKVGDGSGPAEICVVIGGSRNAQAQGTASTPGFSTFDSLSLIFLYIFFFPSKSHSSGPSFSGCVKVLFCLELLLSWFNFFQTG